MSTSSNNTGGPPMPTGAGLFDDNPDVDSPSCQLLGPTALVVQGLMGILVILSLVYKRHREKPMRPWRIWIFDVSKQIFGQMFVHGVNVLISGVISDVTNGNACVSYFLNILIDTTFGVAIIYGVLHALTYLFSEKMGLKGFESGVYGNPPSLNYWLRQAATYVCALTTMKLVVIALLVIFPAIFDIAEWLLSWTRPGDNDQFQVIFVMGIFPIAMNVLQFWLIDSIVKASSGPVALEPDVEDSAHPDREPLFDAPSDDEDDGAYHGRRAGDLENQLPHHPSRSSLDSRAKSYVTGITTPDDDDHKSLDKAKEESPVRGEHHSYPPSLSNSFTSTSSASAAKRSSSSKRLASNPVSRSNSVGGGGVGPAASPPTNNQRAAPAPREQGAVVESDEWAVSWDEEDDGWGGEQQANADTSKTHNGPGANSIPQTELTRPRRLS